QKNSAFLGAEIPSLVMPEKISKKNLRHASFSGRVALTTLEEAWRSSALDEIESDRVGLIIGGSNVQQREVLLTQERYRNNPHFIRPHYGFSFMDSDLCGLCTECFNIQGLSCTVGGASASGHLAILQAISAVSSGQVDVCIALGALMDFSYFELQALRSLGAMGSDSFAQQPDKACRPFDRDRDGFIFGECCGAVVIERSDTAAQRGVGPYANIIGWAAGMDAHRNPSPSYEGEVKMIQQALRHANLSSREIDYVNPHGTGSKIGDEVELNAIVACGLSHAHINATKSITGHGISAAGTVEVIATILQMEASRIHPTRQLECPIKPELKWVCNEALFCNIEHALNLSIGFGGINTAICLRNCSQSVKAS
ncbi:MAG: beta-ketoacyl synthase N-terminal-like domain-containing protein, partial [Waddliaceae bacterium]